MKTIQERFGEISAGVSVFDKLGNKFEVKRLQRKGEDSPSNLVELKTSNGSTFVVEEKSFGDYRVAPLTYNEAHEHFAERMDNAVRDYEEAVAKLPPPPEKVKELIDLLASEQEKLHKIAKIND